MVKFHTKLNAKTRKPQPKRGAGERIIQRRMRVADLSCRGYSQFEIAQKEGVTQPVICQDLKWVKEQWKREAVKSLDEAQQTELARIEHLRKVAWEAWERSRLDAQSTLSRKEMARRVNQAAKGLETNGRNGKAVPKAIPIPQEEMVLVKELSEKTSKGQVGNPSFLAVIQWCEEARSKILGLYKDVTFNQNNVNVVSVDWSSMSGRPVEPDPIEGRIEGVKLLSAPKSDVIDAEVVSSSQEET